MSSNKISRAIRRHHHNRISRNFRKKLEKGWLGSMPEPYLTYRLVRWCENRAICSCDGCGNQRHCWGRTNLTMAELRAKDAEKDQWVDYFTDNNDN